MKNEEWRNKFCRRQNLVLLKLTRSTLPYPNIRKCFNLVSVGDGVLDVPRNLELQPSDEAAILNNTRPEQHRSFRTSSVTTASCHLLRSRRRPKNCIFAVAKLTGLPSYPVFNQTIFRAKRKMFHHSSFSNKFALQIYYVSFFILH